jgi:hypothetical protein
MEYDTIRTATAQSFSDLKQNIDQITQQLEKLFQEYRGAVVEGNSFDWMMELQYRQMALQVQGMQQSYAQFVLKLCDDVKTLETKRVDTVKHSIAQYLRAMAVVHTHSPEAAIEALEASELQLSYKPCDLLTAKELELCSVFSSSSDLTSALVDWTLPDLPETQSTLMESACKVGGEPGRLVLTQSGCLHFCSHKSVLSFKLSESKVSVSEQSSTLSVKPPQKWFASKAYQFTMEGPKETATWARVLLPCLSCK